MKLPERARLIWFVPARYDARRSEIDPFPYQSYPSYHLWRSAFPRPRPPFLEMESPLRDGVCVRSCANVRSAELYIHAPSKFGCNSDGPISGSSLDPTVHGHGHGGDTHPLSSKIKGIGRAGAWHWQDS